MQNQSSSSFSACRLRSLLFGALPLALLLTGSQVLAQNQSSDKHLSSRHIVGGWYLALDVGPFDPALAGTFLSGIAHFHADKTFMVSDAGDFGAPSFLPTLSTPQYGTWTRMRTRGTYGWHIAGTALSLDAHAESGEAFGWTKVQFLFQVIGRNRVEGTVNAFFLPCDDAAPIPSPLTCPDPIVNADAFIPASPPDVPVTLTRIIAGN